MKKILIANLILVFCLIACNKTKAESMDNYVGKLFYYYDETWNDTNYYYITTYIDTETKERMILNYEELYTFYVGHFDTLVTNINNVYYYISISPDGESTQKLYKAIIFNNNEMKVISIPQAYSYGHIEAIIRNAHTNIYKIDNSDMNSYFSEKVGKFFINLKNSKGGNYYDEETRISFYFPEYGGEEIDMRYSLYSDASYIEALKQITGNDKKVNKKVEENTKNEPTKNNAKITDLSKKIKLIDFRVCSDRDVERFLKDIDSLSENEREELAGMLLIHSDALIYNDRDRLYNYYRKAKNEQTYKFD